MNNNPIIIGIESSCDDTAAAILQGEKVLSNIVSTQKIHKEYGGVVPELASREHQKNIIPVVDIAIKEAGITKNEIDAIAFTKGPGLLGSLLVGTSFVEGQQMGIQEAKTLEYYSNQAGEGIQGKILLGAGHFPALII